jgi:translation initiation factor 2B subunit (eIF-2B alpha/beta/delta family)
MARREAKPQASATMLAKASRRFDQDKALIVLRKGNAIDQATILEETFAIDTEELGILNVPTKLIKTIILKNGTLFPLDVIRMLKGNEISGTVLTDPVHADSEEVGGHITIPLKKILSIVF